MPCCAIRLCVYPEANSTFVSDPFLAQPAGQITAVHIRHDHVRDQNVDRADEVAGDRKRYLAVLGRQHVIAVFARLRTDRSKVREQDGQIVEIHRTISVDIALSEHPAAGGAEVR